MQILCDVQKITGEGGSRLQVTGKGLIVWRHRRPSLVTLRAGADVGTGVAFFDMHPAGGVTSWSHQVPVPVPRREPPFKHSAKITHTTHTTANISPDGRFDPFGNSDGNGTRFIFFMGV